MGRWILAAALALAGGDLPYEGEAKLMDVVLAKVSAEICGLAVDPVRYETAKQAAVAEYDVSPEAVAEQEARAVAAVEGLGHSAEETQWCRTMAEFARTMAVLAD